MRPILELSLSSPLSLSAEADRIGWHSNELLAECQSIIDFHWRLFSNRAVSISYSPNEGYSLVASSGVGAIGSERLSIRVVPKIPNIRIEKILSMAQYAGLGIWKIGDGKVAAQIDEVEDYQFHELLGFALSDAVGQVISNGLHREFRDEVTRSLTSGSPPDLEANMNSGFSPPHFVLEVVQDLDIPVNQVLKAALAKVHIQTSHNGLRTTLGRHLSSLESVEAPRSLVPSEAVSKAIFTLPRPDYKKALALSIAILNDQPVSLEGPDQHHLPSVMLDMDLVFEKFCSKVLKDSLDASFFDVMVQQPFAHQSNPELTGRSIIPDVVIRKASSGDSLVLDLKNKYASISPAGKPSFSNADLFQQHYYSANLSAFLAILLYPSDNPEWQFPLPGSESLDAYRSKVENSLASAKFPLVSISHPNHDMSLLPLQVDLSGNMKNTINSLKRIAFLIQHFLNHR